MADKKKQVVRTVAFWRIVDAQTGQPLRQQVNWPRVMAKLDERRRSGRSNLLHHVDGVEMTGGIYTRDNVDHLILTNERDDMPRQRDRRTGEVADMATKDEGWGAIETSFIKFADFGNVFGLLRSQITAPSPQAVAKWLNQTGLISRRLAVDPVIDPQRWHHLRQAGSVSKLEFAAPSFVLDKEVTGPLSYFLGPARRGSYKIDLKLTAIKKREPEYERERRELKEAAEGLASQIGVEYLDKAKATVFDEDLTGIKIDTINLLKQRFTIKRAVNLTGGSSSSVSESSAFDAILEGFEKFGDDLRAAVRDSPLD